MGIVHTSKASIPSGSIGECRPGTPFGGGWQEGGAATRMHVGMHEGGGGWEACPPVIYQSLAANGGSSLALPCRIERAVGFSLAAAFVRGGLVRYAHSAAPLGYLSHNRRGRGVS